MASEGLPGSDDRPRDGGRGIGSGRTENAHVPGRTLKGPPTPRSGPRSIASPPRAGDDATRASRARRQKAASPVRGSAAGGSAARSVNSALTGPPGPVIAHATPQRAVEVPTVCRLVGRFAECDPDAATDRPRANRRSAMSTEEAMPRPPRVGGGFGASRMAPSAGRGDAYGGAEVTSGRSDGVYQWYGLARVLCDAGKTGTWS